MVHFFNYFKQWNSTIFFFFVFNSNLKIVDKYSTVLIEFLASLPDSQNTDKPTRTQSKQSIKQFTHQVSLAK